MLIDICFEYYRNDGDITNLNSHLVKFVEGVKLIGVDLSPKNGDATTDEIKDIIIDIAKEYIKGLFSEPEHIKKFFPTVYKKSMTCQYWFHVIERDFIKLSQKQFEPESPDEPRSFEEIMGDDSNDSPTFNIDMIDIVLDKDLNLLDCQPDPINYWDTI